LEMFSSIPTERLQQIASRENHPHDTG